MKKTLLILFAFGLNITSIAQYWQQRVDYVIDVSLNDKEKTLDAFEKITYHNNSPDTLRFIWFHLWPNAYKNDRTAFSDQMLENDKTDFYFSNKEERGYINRLDFKVDGHTAKTEDHPQHIDIIKLLLPEPLPPGKQIVITTPFHVKLPYNYSRGGYEGESFQVTQWYPKPAVYDKKGWHPMPYLDQGEYFSEFGSYDVRITLPDNYIVAATGEMQGAAGQEYKKENYKDRHNEYLPQKKLPGKTTPKVKNLFPPSSTQMMTVNFKQENIHDFAWFADKRFWMAHDTVQLSSGKTIDLFSYYLKKEKSSAEDVEGANGIDFMKSAIRFYSNEVGEYPYNVASVVEGPESFGGGMEYPTITIISPVADKKIFDQIVAHELGHNWFQGILASNERMHPWMDEGMNSFYDSKYMEMKYGSSPVAALDLVHQTKSIRKTDQPIETTSEKFTASNYGLIAYFKTSAWMRKLENELGTQAFKVLMQDYFNKWKFKHPYPEDFETLVKTATNKDVQNLFESLETKGILSGDEPKGFSVVSPFIKNSIKSFISEPSKNILFLSPAFGINSYDRFMIGGFISNYKLPPNKFQFLAIPMYATGSKKFAGLARLNYSIHSDKLIRKTDIFLNAANFSMDEFEDTAGRKLFMRFNKLVPGFRLTFRENNPRNTVEKFIQWKTFLFREQSLRINSDTIISGNDTSLILRYLLPESDSYINQLQFSYNNFRALYPFDLKLLIEQSQDFIRPSITANYFFNYREGGLQFRFFAGKFIYLNGKTISKQFRNDRYYLCIGCTVLHKDDSVQVHNCFFDVNDTGLTGKCLQSLMGIPRV